MRITVTCLRALQQIEMTLATATRFLSDPCSCCLAGASGCKVLCRGAFAARRTRQVVLRLADVHPVAGQREREQRIVARDQRERLLLNAGRPQLDALEHPGRQHVDARVDLVAHKNLPHRREAE